MESTYLYSVHPKKIIKGLLEQPIRTARSLYLTKEQVKVCLKYGSVYRRFANENKIERVLISNIDRLHNEKFMTESEYEQYKKSLTDSMRGSVINTDSKATPVSEDTNREEKVEEKPATVEPEIKEETPVSEENNEPPVAASETTPVSEDTNREEKVEEKPATVEPEIKEETPKNNNYGGKNNKHRR